MTIKEKADLLHAEGYGLLDVSRALKRANYDVDFARDLLKISTGSKLELAYELTVLKKKVKNLEQLEKTHEHYL